MEIRGIGIESGEIVCGLYIAFVLFWNLPKTRIEKNSTITEF